MEPDLLGPEYTARVIELPPDDEGEVVATLVTRRAPEPTTRAVLYVHGYADYFFQDHLAQFWVDEGYDFYALDVRKFGRSLRPHQTPNFALDMAEYDEELNAAARIIRDDDEHGILVVMAHSMGGLVTSLWAHRRRDEGVVDALVLNSPWFDHNGPWAERVLAPWVIDAVGARRSRAPLPRRMRLSANYGRSIHRDHRGEWDFNADWKPPGGFPTYAGWARAIWRAQVAVGRGLDIRCPVLVACSTRSVSSARWSDDLLRADGLLNVEHMVRRGSRLGRLVTIARIPDGMHDLTLSAKEPRETFFAELRRWCGAYVP